MPVLTLDPGVGVVRTFTAPASIVDETYQLRFTATDSTGVSTVKVVSVFVPAATYAVPSADGAGYVPLQMSYNDPNEEASELAELQFTPANLQDGLLAAQATYQQLRVDTDPPGIVVTRATQVRTPEALNAEGAVIPAGPWLPEKPAEVTRAGPFLLTFGGTQDGGDLIPGNTYDGRVVGRADGFDSFERIVTFTTAAENTQPPPPPPPPPPGTVKYERWFYPADVRAMLESKGQVMAPGYVRYTWLPAGSRRAAEPGTTAVYGNAINSLRGKVWAVCPEVFVNPLNGEFILDFEGVVQGCLVQYTGWRAKNTGQPLGNVLTKRDGSKQPMRLGGATDDATEYNFSTTQTGLKGAIANAKFMDWGGGIPNAFRVMEGCGILDGPDGWQYIMELVGYNHGGPDQNDTLVFNHCRFANHDTSQGLSWISNGGSAHYQGDVFQPINGPAKIYMLDTVGVTSYQWFFGQMGGDHKYQYMRRVHIKGQRPRTDPFIPGGQSSLIWDTSRGDPSVVRDIGSGENGVFLDTIPGRTMSRIIYGTSQYAIPDWQKYQIAVPPKDFNPYSNMVPWSATDARWSTSYPKVG